MSILMSRLAALPLAAGLVACPALVPALAHATFETAEAKQNSYYKGIVKVPHGCNGQPTHTVRVRIPAGVIAVKPMPKAGWAVQTTKAAYDKPYVLHGSEVKEGVSEIVWSGGNLADDQYDEFVFQARITDRVNPGTMHVPVVQECADGKVAWTEIPAAGQDPHALRFPAPGIRIVAASQSGGGHGSDHGGMNHAGMNHTGMIHGNMAHQQMAQHQHGAGHGAAQPARTGQPIRVGDLEITAPWSRATPGGAKVAGGFMSITNKGSAPDRLVGGSVEIAGVFEVHEMKMDGNVMRMRALEKGLEIKPGETVELKPGGFHVMFLDLKQPLKAGDTIKGTLVFEKAGKIDVTYSVQAPGAGAGQHKH